MLIEGSKTISATTFCRLFFENLAYVKKKHYLCKPNDEMSK